MSTHKKVRKNLTYEQIGNTLSISPQQVHKIEKEAINKIINTLLNDSRFNIFEVVVNLSEFFGVEPHQVYGKLNKKNKQLMYKFVNETYGKEHEDMEDVEDYFLDDLFG